MKIVKVHTAFTLLVLIMLSFGLRHGHTENEEESLWDYDWYENNENCQTCYDSDSLGYSLPARPSCISCDRLADKHYHTECKDTGCRLCECHDLPCKYLSENPGHWDVDSANWVFANPETRMNIFEEWEEEAQNTCLDYEDQYNELLDMEDIVKTLKIEDDLLRKFEDWIVINKGKNEVFHKRACALSVAKALIGKDANASDMANALSENEVPPIKNALRDSTRQRHAENAIECTQIYFPQQAIGLRPSLQLILPSVNTKKIESEREIIDEMEYLKFLIDESGNALPLSEISEKDRKNFAQSFVMEGVFEVNKEVASGIEQGDPLRRGLFEMTNQFMWAQVNMISVTVVPEGVREKWKNVFLYGVDYWDDQGAKLADFVWKSMNEGYRIEKRNENYSGAAISLAKTSIGTAGGLFTSFAAGSNNLLARGSKSPEGKAAATVVGMTALTLVCPQCTGAMGVVLFTTKSGDMVYNEVVLDEEAGAMDWADLGLSGLAALPFLRGIGKMPPKAPPQSHPAAPKNITPPKTPPRSPSGTGSPGGPAVKTPGSASPKTQSNGSSARTPPSSGETPGSAGNKSSLYNGKNKPPPPSKKTPLISDELNPAQASELYRKSILKGYDEKFRLAAERAAKGGASGKEPTILPAGVYSIQRGPTCALHAINNIFKDVAKITFTSIKLKAMELSRTVWTRPLVGPDGTTVIRGLQHGETFELATTLWQEQGGGIRTIRHTMRNAEVQAIKELQFTKRPLLTAIRTSDDLHAVAIRGFFKVDGKIHVAMIDSNFGETIFMELSEFKNAQAAGYISFR
ncbi:hypothetical protein ACFL6Y_05350 [Elusimicrobiota bacterium]